VTGDWCILLNEDVHNLYSSDFIMVIKCMRMRWAGHIAHMGKIRSDYEFFSRKTSRRPFEKPMHRWQDVLNMSYRIRT